MSEPLRVLILEDRPADAALLLHALHQAGFAPVCQRVDTEADYLAHLDAALDVILADYNLPEFNALRALRLLQEHGLDVPFIIISGAIGEERAVECLQQGATDYLLKDRLARLGPAVAQAVAQKHLRHAKRQAEAKFATIFRTSPNSILVTRLDDGVCLEASDRFTQVTGYAAAEIIGKAPLELRLWVDPADRQQIVQMLRTHGEVRDLEVAFRTKDGAVKIGLFSATLIDIDGQPHILSVTQDISDRKQAEEALAAEARFLRAQTDIGEVALSSLRTEVLAPRLLEAICRAQNYAYGLLWRTTDEGRAAVVVASYGDNTTPFLGYRLELDGPASCIAQTIHTRQATFCNRVQESPHGTRPVAQALGGKAFLILPLVDRTGKVLGALAFGDARDPERFSERDLQQGAILARQVAQALENSELYSQIQRLQEQYRVVTEALNDAVYLVDQEGRILFANAALERLTGYRKEELLGRPSTMFYISEEIPEILQRRHNAYSGKYVAPYPQVQIVRKDGQRVAVELSMATLAQGGQMVGRVAVARDITERLHLEAQLRQVQKLEAIGTLAGGIAHDFNNILAAVLGYTELALEDTPQHSMARSNLEQVFMAGERARGLVQQILAFSRQAEQERKPIHLPGLIKEVLKLLRAALPTTIAIRQELDEHTGTVLADPTQMHQVLMNLCTNAAHAMRDTGGELTVRLEAVEVTADLAAHLHVASGPYVRLTIRDTGHGMAPEVMERIFEPFFTTKGVGEGTGMGLAVAHGIVTSYGGAITVESAPGQGTTFTVSLPCGDQEAAATALLEEPVSMGTGRILFVDDEAVLARLGHDMLTRLGYDVVMRTSSLEALEAFRAAPERFDLVITDQTMPNLTGAALARELRYIRPNIPIILCTGFSHTMTAEKAQALGIDAFCLKPLLVRDLAPTIRRVLAPRTTA